MQSSPNQQPMFGMRFEPALGEGTPFVRIFVDFGLSTYCFAVPADSVHAFLSEFRSNVQAVAGVAKAESVKWHQAAAQHQGDRLEVPTLTQLDNLSDGELESIARTVRDAAKATD